jgi:hypothetical protein
MKRIPVFQSSDGYTFLDSKSPLAGHILAPDDSWTSGLCLALTVEGNCRKVYIDLAVEAAQRGTRGLAWEGAK